MAATTTTSVSKFTKLLTNFGVPSRLDSSDGSQRPFSHFYDEFRGFVLVARVPPIFHQDLFFSPLWWKIFLPTYRRILSPYLFEIYKEHHMLSGWFYYVFGAPIGTLAIF